MLNAVSLMSMFNLMVSKNSGSKGGGGGHGRRPAARGCGQRAPRGSGVAAARAAQVCVPQAAAGGAEDGESSATQNLRRASEWGYATDM